MKFTTVNAAELRETLKSIRAELDALARERRSLPLTAANLDRLQNIQDRSNELHEEFKRVSALCVTH